MTKLRIEKQAKFLTLTQADMQDQENVKNAALARIMKKYATISQPGSDAAAAASFSRNDNTRGGIIPTVAPPQKATAKQRILALNKTKAYSAQ